MSEKEIFIRQIRHRSNEHIRAMEVLSAANIPSQMIAVLRQELDSMVRVIYLLSQEPSRQTQLIEDSVNGRKWQQSRKGNVTDREMVELAQQLQGWTQSVYKFGGAFIHLSNLHDYNNRDPLKLLTTEEQDAILEHCRHYHGGPEQSEFTALIPYLPRVLQKVTSNLECYLAQLGESSPHKPDQI